MEILGIVAYLGSAFLIADIIEWGIFPMGHNLRPLKFEKEVY